MEEMNLDFNFNGGEIHSLLEGNWNDAAGRSHHMCE